MVRFSASKYKNAECKFRREDFVTGIRIGELCQNQPIACGAEKIVYTGMIGVTNRLPNLPSCPPPLHNPSP